MRISPGTRLDHYEILGPLGTGGMGEVYRARDEKLGRQVALKVLRPEHTRDADRLRRFEREAFSASALNHPNIVTIFDIGQSEGVPYIIMERIDGQTLRERLDDGPVPVTELLLIAIQTADGLAKAHDAGIVHRDLKPENIMITSDGVVKILDFGLAKLTETAFADPEMGTLGRAVTSAGMILGTVGYMSPEQASGRTVEHFADQFSLGTILYEMATGTRAFRGNTPVQTLSAIIEENPAPVTSLKPGAPHELSELISRLLAKDPAARFSSTRELVVALTELRAKVASDSPPPPYVALKDTRPSEVARRSCPNCQQSNPLGVNFCGHCGARFAESSVDDHESPTISSPSDSLPSAERRHCAVLSTSLSGYASLIEKLPPEKVDAIVRGLHALAIESVESLEGLVNELQEEELVAVFGLPRSREDDSLRATRAARLLHQRVREELATRFGLSLRMQTGISTGILVAKPVSGDMRRYKLAGRPLELSHRLALNAEEDEILVTSDTERLLASCFELEPAENIKVKGRGTVSTRRVLSESKARTRLEALEASGLTPYSGRESELETLRSCLDRAASGDGQFVTVVGDVGVGKSRLLYELSRSVEGDRVSVLDCHCESYGARTPFLPWIEMLRDALGLSGEHEERQLTDHMRRSVLEVSAELEIYLPIYLNLLSLESEELPLPKHLQGEDLRLAILEAISALFLALSRKKPVALVFEDWHWADEASRAALRHLLGLVEATSLLVVVSYRPELSVDWGELRSHTRMVLGPLPESSTFNIIHAALGAEDVPEGLEDLIHERTGGNPFFTEEVCRSLLESGTARITDGRVELSGSLDDIHIPDSVQAVIRSRLDRLDSADLDLLRRASVIGREFSRDVLERSLPARAGVGRPLERLKSSGLINQVRLLPEAIYRFHHVLTQEVAYDSLLEHQRKQLHEAVGTAIEGVYADHLDEHLDLLAHHFSLAESWEKAVRYGRAGTTRAVNLMQLPEALDLLTHTRGWLARLPDSHRNRELLVELLLQEERIYETLGERARQQELIDTLFSSLPKDDEASRAEVCLRQGELFTLVGKEEKAGAAFDEAERLGRELNDPTLVRNVLRSQGFLAWKRGRPDEAKTLNEKALAIDRTLGDYEAIAGDLHNLAQVERSLHQHTDALSHLQESLEISERHQHPIRAIYAHNTMASVYRDMGDLDEPLTLLERSSGLADRYRLPVHMTFTLTNLAGIRRDRGEQEEAIRLLREALELSESKNYTEGRANALRNLGDILESVSRHEEAIDCKREAAGLFTQLHDAASEAQIWTTLAPLFAGRERYEEATEAWKRAVDLYRVMGDPPRELAAREGLARSLRVSSPDPESALAQYGLATELAAKLDEPRKEAELRNEMGILEWTRGHLDEALSQYELALSTFVALGDEVHQGLMLNSIGVTLKDMSRRDEARSRLEESLAVNRRSGERMLEGHTLAILGQIDASEGDLGSAVERFQSSLDIRRELGDERGEAWMSYEMARALRAKGEPEAAREHLGRAMELASRLDDARLEASCKNLVQES